MEIIRERLIGRIAGERVTIIKAPSGFGKSTLVRQFLERFPDIRVCYLSVRHLDKYPKQFINRFVNEMRSVLGDEYFIRSSALLEEGSFDAGAITQSFVKEMAEVNDSFLVIVGGVDDLSGDSIVFLKDLLRYSRDDIAYIFTTESDLDPELERSAQWSYERIGARDLKFNDTEIAAIFDDGLSETEIERVSEYTGGWPFGITVLRRVWDSKESLEEVMSDSLPEMETYFSEKLFKPLSSSLKGFLIKSSLLVFVEPGVIKALFGKNGTLALEEAQSLQLFSAADKPDYYTLQPLFATYLKKRAAQEIDKEGISSFYTEVADVYRKRGDAFYAVYYAVKSGVSETINETVAALFDDVIVFGDEDFQILVDVATEDSESKGLDLIRAINVYRKLDYKWAKDAFGKLWRATVEDADVIFGIAVWHYAYILSFLGETDAEFSGIIGDWPEDNEAASFILMAQTVDIDNRYGLDGMYETCKRAIAIAEGSHNPNWLTALYCSGTSLSRLKGFYTDAAEFAEKSVFIGKRRPIALKHLVEITLDLDEPGKAAGYLKELELLERSLPLRFRYLVNAVRGYFALNNLRLDEASDYCKRVAENYLTVYGKLGKGEIFGDLFVAEVLLGEDLPDLIASLGEERDVYELFADSSRLWRPLMLYNFLQGDISDKIEELLPLAEERKLPYSTGFLYLLRALSSVRDGDIESAEDDIAKLQTGVNEDLVTRVTRKILLTDDYRLRLPGDINADKEPGATINFLGGLSVKYSDKTLTEKDWEQRRALSLFAFLVKQRDETFTTERLIANMWPESDLDKGKQSLKTAIKHIRVLLGDFGLTEVINYSSKLYYLAGGAFGETDIEKLDNLVEAAEIAIGEGDKEKALGYLKDAERINRADFLPNLYDDWADRYLHYYRILRMDTLERICNLLGELGRRDDFLTYSARLIMAAGNDETTQYILEENAAKLGVDISYILNR